MDEKQKLHPKIEKILLFVSVGVNQFYDLVIKYCAERDKNLMFSNSKLWSWL